LDFGKSENMLFSSKETQIAKIVLPAKVKFMMHTIAKPSLTGFKRSTTA
jgi:hypothetical protein